MDKKIICGFMPLVDKPEHTQTDYTKDKDIVGYTEEDYIVKTGEGDKDFIVKKRVVEFERKNRQEYINSFTDDIGVLNVLKKCALSNDESLIKQRPDGAFMDATGFPTCKEDIYNTVEKGVTAFDKLPDDIKKKMSMEQFVNSFGQEQFDELINSKVQEILAKKEAKQKSEE